LTPGAGSSTVMVVRSWKYSIRWEMYQVSLTSYSSDFLAW